MILVRYLRHGTRGPQIGLHGCGNVGSMYASAPAHALVTAALFRVPPPWTRATQWRNHSRRCRAFAGEGRGPTRYCARHISQRTACRRPEPCRWARHQLFRQVVWTHLIVPVHNVILVVAVPEYSPEKRMRCDLTQHVHRRGEITPSCATSLTESAPEQRQGAMRSPISVSPCAPQHMRH